MHARCGDLRSWSTPSPGISLGVYYDAIDHFCHRFMHYHPPRMEHVPEADFALYSNVIWSAYCFHDLMLGRLLELAGDEATVILVSDHGYHCDHLRPMATPREFSGPAQWHRGLGVCAMKGPGLRRDELLFGATILDVAPTVLTLLGLPVGADMDGKPWLNAFEEPPAVQTIPSWDAVPGPCGMHAEDRRGDPFHEREALAQLVDLGYIAAPPEDEHEAGRIATIDRDYNLAQALLDARKPGQALPILERLHAELPDRLLIALHLVNAYLALDRREECRRVIDHIAEGHCSQATIEGPEVKLVAQVDYLRGLLEQAEGRDEAALDHFRRAQAQGTRLRGFYANLGWACARLQRWAEARDTFATALDLNPDDASAHHGMAAVFLADGQDEPAMEHALRSIGLIYHQPRAHRHLGVALMRLGEFDRALQAFEVSRSMAPNQPDVHRALAHFHETVTKDSARAAEHRRRAEELSARPARAEVSA